MTELKFAASLTELTANSGTVYGMIMNHRDMSRQIRFMVATIDDSGKPYLIDITFYIALILKYRQNKNGSITVRGCGFDAVQHVVDHLSSVLKITLKSETL